MTSSLRVVCARTAAPGFRHAYCSTNDPRDSHLRRNHGYMCFSARLGPCVHFDWQFPQPLRAATAKSRLAQGSRQAPISSIGNLSWRPDPLKQLAYGVASSLAERLFAHAPLLYEFPARILPRTIPATPPETQSLTYVLHSKTRIMQTIRLAVPAALSELQPPDLEGTTIGVPWLVPAVC